MAELNGGEQLLPLLEHLVRVGRRAGEAGWTGGGLRLRHLAALGVIGGHGPMTQHAVALALSLDPSNVVGLLNELEERGLTVRRRDPADRRRHIVELSAAGSGQVAEASARLERVEDQLFGVLNAEERHIVYTLFSRVVEAAISVAAAPASLGDSHGDDDGETVVEGG